MIPIIKLSIAGALALSIASCSNNQKVADAKENVAEAKEKVAEAYDDLVEARIDSANDLANYRKEKQEKLEEYDEKIAALKASMKQEKKEIRDKYNKELEALEYKNAQVKMNLYDYKEGAKDQWDAFKLGVNKDMDELGKAISAMANKNMKKDKN